MSHNNKVSLRLLGQAGCLVEFDGCTVVIDPYLTDSAGKDAPLFSRVFPPPIKPDELKADVFIVTHDHIDHLDPETINAYKYKDTTTFIAPRHAAKKLIEIGIKNLKVVDHGDTVDLSAIKITGVFALSTDPNTIDTCGYLLTFPNGKSLYHTSDTGYCELLLKAAPNADVLLTCINGKFGNLNIEEAIKLTKAVNPLFVIPNHYDVMALNAENPESFRYFCDAEGLKSKCVVLKPLEEFQW